MLRSGSGSIRRRINEILRDGLSQSERRNLATLIYYPRQELPLILQTVDDEREWYRTTLLRLIKVCRVAMSKYPRTTVAGFLPTPCATIGGASEGSSLPAQAEPWPVACRDACLPRAARGETRYRLWGWIRGRF